MGRQSTAKTAIIGSLENFRLYSMQHRDKEVSERSELTPYYIITIFMIYPISEEDDWNGVIKECSSLAAEWKQLSGYLGLSIATIDTIKENFPNNAADCLNEALKHWIRQNYRTARYGYPSWRMLLEAIARIDKLLFKRLADKHQGIIMQNWPSNYNDPFF